ncbi:unnamed protein product [Anisakis simplex]|uniref:Uncharacterized protein n=1 Tax=Anisakis simplex TaxID=6269 RepID=A0A3P6NVU6_ANISI|nr:unnamed protein product [Anisakis simplex]
MRLVAEGDPSADLGDTSTLINAWVIGKLWQGRLSTRTRIQPSFK